MTFRACVFAVLALSASAEEPFIFVPLKPETPLAQLLMLGSRPEAANSSSGYDEIRCATLDLLAKRKRGSAYEERAIKDVLLGALSAIDSRVRCAGAAGLARRGIRSEVPKLFTLMEQDPQPLAAYFRALDSPRNNPPVASLRLGLSTHNPDARAAVVEVIGLCRVHSLAAAIENLLRTDDSPSVRDQSAIALALLGSRESRRSMLDLSRRGYHSVSLARGLIELGGDREVEALLPLLWDDDSAIRSLVADGFARMPLNDREAVTRGLLVALRDTSPKVRLPVIKTLAHFREVRAIPILRKTLPATRDLPVEDRTALVQAIATFGDELAIPLLNEMMNWRFRKECGLETTLAKLGDPTSGRVAWNAYVDAFEKWRAGGDNLVDEYTSARPVIVACADASLLSAIRARAEGTTDPIEKEKLGSLAESVSKRLSSSDGASQRQRSFAPDALAPPEPAGAFPDSDRDGVPDVRDKYPKDPRRVEDIPTRAVKLDVLRFGMIPLRKLSAGSLSPEFLTIDDDGRVGYLERDNADDSGLIRAFSTDGIKLARTWALPNPGKIPGLARLAPCNMNAKGTVIGSALWKTQMDGANPTGDAARLAPGSGFIFKAGKLTMDPAPPFTATTLRCSFKSINQRGQIFGLREQRFSDDIGNHFKTVAFLDDHVFRDVLPFEVTTLTENGRLLCYRAVVGGRENFVWDGSRFLELGSLRGNPLRVRAIAMNDPLQVIGESDAVDQSGHAIGFLWENGVMRPLTDFIAGEQRIWLRSVTPKMISSTGSVVFSAMIASDDASKIWKERHFSFTPRAGEETFVQIHSYE